MKVIVSIVLVLGMLSFAQCSNQKSGKELGEFNRVDSISIQDMNYPELLGIGLQVIKMDSLFIVNDFRGDSLLNIYNANTHKVERKLISKGNGPDEMSSPLDVKIIQDKIYVLSRPRFQFAYLLKDSIFTNNKMYGHTMLPQMSDCFLPLNDSVFVFSGMWESVMRYIKKEERILCASSENIRIFGKKTRISRQWPRRCSIKANWLNTRAKIFLQRAPDMHWMSIRMIRQAKSFLH